MNNTSLPYRTLPLYLKNKFGTRIQKLPLDAGFTCPNRDGTFSHKGCSFCNPEGSGTGLLTTGMNLCSQWEYWRSHFQKRYKTAKFIAYLQSYTNTYGSLERICSVLSELENLPDLIGLSMGTRPDCLDEKKLDHIAAFPAPEIHLELGLQSANDQTLQRINRGHTASCFAKATHMAHKRGIKVVAHLMAGLPKEGKDHFLHSIDFINTLPVHGVKIHNLYICKGSTLEKQFLSAQYIPLAMEDYIQIVVEALAKLRPDIIIHRINGDPAPRELIAPLWAKEKQTVINAIHTQLKEQNIVQGKNYFPA